MMNFFQVLLMFYSIIFLMGSIAEKDKDLAKYFVLAFMVDIVVLLITYMGEIR